MSYCIARALPAGSLRRGPVRVARRGDEQRLVLRQHAGERVVGRVPALVLGVPLVHREARDPGVGEHVLVGEPEPRRRAPSGAARARRWRPSPRRRRRSGRGRRAGARRRGDPLGAVVAEELGDRALDRRRSPRPRGAPDPRRRIASPARRARRSRAAWRRPRPGATIAFTDAARGEVVVEHAEARGAACRRRRSARERDSPSPSRIAGPACPSRSGPSPRRRSGAGTARPAIGRSGTVARETSTIIDSTKSITAASSTKLISRSSWVNSGWRSPRRSSSRKQRAIWK